MQARSDTKLIREARTIDVYVGLGFRVARFMSN